jgi:peptidyl-prolyl cis-trans isomerase D
MGFEDDSKIGTVKKILANVGHVIARVKGIDNSGLVSITQVKPYVEPILKTRKSRINQS